MSLTKIYSSKLYLSSDRKDSIRAAMQSPVNLELVQQISDYLDDDSKKLLQEAVSDNESKASEASEPAEENVFDEYNKPDADIPTSHHSSSAPHSSGSVFDDFDSNMGDVPTADESPSDADSADVPDADASEAPADEITESTAVTSEQDISGDDLDTPVVQSGIVKKLLNSQEDTDGVVRVDVDDNETWIYYDDKVNLNDVLDNVISIIKSNGYDMLKFSRLARTDNAVVFDIKE